jgi:hypothetical protein
MYKYEKAKPTTIKVNASYQGERIEQKIQRIVNNKEPITDGAPIIYTERKDGVRPEYNIKTDRWEVAIDAMDVVSKTNTAKREYGIGERTFDTLTPEQQKVHVERFPQSKHNKKTEGGA